MADNALTKMSVTGQIGVGLAVAVAILGGFYFLYWDDASVERDQKQERVQALTEQIRALEVTANRLQEFQREVQLLEAKLETLKRILPPVKEIPDLMRKMQSLASQSNLQIRTFTPKAMVNREFYQEQPIDVAVTGTYHNLAIFFDRISRLSRLVNVGTLKIAAFKEASPSRTIDATCVATTFIYVETPPGGAAPAAGPPARGGRAPRPPRPAAR
jgi:type IV pilus assembly protein PilO